MELSELSRFSLAIVMTLLPAISSRINELLLISMMRFHIPGVSRATHWPHTGLYIAISPPLGHDHSFTLYQYTPILSPQPLQAMTWGDPNDGRLVFPDNGYGYLPVTRNCFNAMRRLRRKDQDRKVWIDAVCLYLDRH
jgi:hypothetical protein